MSNYVPTQVCNTVFQLDMDTDRDIEEMLEGHQLTEVSNRLDELDDDEEYGRSERQAVVVTTGLLLDGNEVRHFLRRHGYEPAGVRGLIAFIKANPDYETPRSGLVALGSSTELKTPFGWFYCVPSFKNEAGTNETSLRVVEDCGGDTAWGSSQRFLVYLR